MECLEPRHLLAAAPVDCTVVFNELMYHPADDAAGLEWVELYNQMAVDMELSNWSLDGAVKFAFPSGTIIRGGAYLVVAADPAALKAASGYSGAIGPWSGSLSNGGETVTLRNNNARLMDQIEYNDKAPWPEASDGSGASLAKADPMTTSGPAVNWRASRQVGGTVGAVNFPTAAASARLAVSEIAAAGATPWWIELRNYGTTAIELQNYVLRTALGPEYVFPAATLAANQYQAIDAAQLGFQPADGEKLFLYAPGKTSVLDAVTIDAVTRGRAAGDPTGPVLYASAPTPGETNTFAFHDEVVINEIMYHHAPAYGAAYATNDEEWIELHNRAGAAVDLSGWRLAGAIRFQFPAGTILAAGSYMVLSNDATALRLKYPDITIVGDFTGQLSNVDDDIVLLDAPGNPADEVHYYNAAPWPQWPDGGGATLELRDPRADNNRPEAWAASDESARSPWQHYTYTATAVTPRYNPSPDAYNFQDLRFGLLNDGEVLLDNVSVTEVSTGRELVQNKSFTTGTTAWRILGTHQDSRVITDPDNATNKVLHVVANGPMSYLNNLLETTCKYGGSIVAIAAGKQYRISFDAKWLRGSPQLHSELYYNKVAHTDVLAMPDRFGTPGARNSAYVANLGPTYSGLLNEPAVPAAKQAISVSVAAADPDGIAGMSLKWRLDGGAWQTLPMTMGSDGRYRASIPGQSASTAVQFYVQGSDSLGITSTYPAAGANSRALIKVNDGLAASGKQNFRIVMTAADISWLETSINMLNDTRMGATIVYNENEVFYDAGIRLRGSMFSRNNPGTTGYSVQFPADHKFRGVQETITIDRPGVQEILVKHSINHAGGIPGMYDDIVKLISFRGENVGMARLAMTRYGDAFLDSQFDNGSDGTVFKMEGIRVQTQTSDGTPEGIKQPFSGIGWVGNYDITNLGDDKEQYRWNTLIQNNRARDDYSQFIAMANAWALTGQALQDAAAATMDVDEWMRAFAMTSLWGIGDMYTQGNPHNLDMYVRPSDGKVVALPWDMDFVASYSYNSSPYNLQPGFNLTKIIELPVYKRLFYGNMLDIINTTFNTAYMAAWTASYGQTAGADYSTYLTYVGNRSGFALSQLPAKVVLAVTTNGGNNLSVDDTKVKLTGAGWIDVREVRLAGSEKVLPVVWTGLTTWEVTLPLASGANTFNFQAFDRQGRAVGGDTITVTSTVTPTPLQQYLRITEINYCPTTPTVAESAAGFTDKDEFEFIELSNVSSSTTLDLHGVKFTTGIVFDFTASSSILSLASGDRILLVRSHAAFEARYGTGWNVAGTYRDPVDGSGRLDNSGEQLTLLDGNGRLLADFVYDDAGVWPGRADGGGSTLELVDTAGSYSDPRNWRSSIEYGGTPGRASAGPNVVVNEVLAHTDAPLTDAIELYNSSDDPVNIGGWWLSDSSADFFKFQIPANTVIVGHGYLVLYEGHWVDGVLQFADNEFGGGVKGFGLNGAHGDDVWLIQADAAGVVARFADHAEFEAAASGESYGRLQDDHGNWHLYPMERGTLGADNDTGGNRPRVGPLVITEIMYSPKPSSSTAALSPTETAAGFTSLDQMEYVEIHNPGGSAVDLAHWRLEGSVSYAFAAGTSLPARSSMLVVPFNPTVTAMLTAFRGATRYKFATTVKVVGPYTGQLTDAGGTVKLLRPDVPPPTEPTFYPGLLEDEVIYLPSGEGNGDGKSLSRQSATAWGLNQSSWIAGSTTAGAFGQVVGRYVFYNSSRFDGSSDETAIAADKKPLLPGQQASFQNYTSYSRGLNGVMVDIAGLVSTSVSASDFDFKVGNSSDLSSWLPAPAPTISVGSLTPGVHRLTLIWTDNAIENQWIQVTVKATPTKTALPAADVFYFGNAIAETGNHATDPGVDAEVDQSDEAAVRAAQKDGLPAPLTSPYDFNRDRRVNATDELIARTNFRTGVDALQLINLGGGATAASTASSSAIADSATFTILFVPLKAATAPASASSPALTVTPEARMAASPFLAQATALPGLPPLLRPAVSPWPERQRQEPTTGNAPAARKDELRKVRDAVVQSLAAEEPWKALAWLLDLERSWSRRPANKAVGLSATVDKLLMFWR